MKGLNRPTPVPDWVRDCPHCASRQHIELDPLGQAHDWLCANPVCAYKRSLERVTERIDARDTIKA